MTFAVGWGQRVLGVVVLTGVIAVLALLRFDVPIATWVIAGVVGGAALVASVSNLGDRLHVDDDGLRHENVILRRLGLAKERRAPWDAVASAVELDRRTFVLSVEGQRRWVLDAYADPAELRRVLQEHGVPIEERGRPKWRDLGRGSRGMPPS